MPEGHGVVGRATTGGRTGSMWWRRLPGRGTGASRGMAAGVWPGDAARFTRFLQDQPRWSIYWDTVIRYIMAHG